MMSEEVARRRFPRLVIHIPFLYTPDTPLSTSIGAGWTRALSEGGATVELSERLRPLTPLRLRLKTDQGTIEAEAKVVWSGGRVTEGGGVVHGLAFTWMAPDQFQTLRDMFRPLPIMRHAGVRLPLDLPITCHPKNPAGPPLQGRTGNVNRGGLFLRLPRLLPPGTGLEVTVHAPTEPLTVDGAVVWVEPPEIWKPGESIGHGFRFNALTWSTLISLGFLLVEPA
jgi:c-di-GMP-binding flagellar brake protein YcgR